MFSTKNGTCALCAGTGPVLFFKSTSVLKILQQICTVYCELNKLFYILIVIELVKYVLLSVLAVVQTPKSSPLTSVSQNRFSDNSESVNPKVRETDFSVSKREVIQTRERGVTLAFFREREK